MGSFGSTPIKSSEEESARVKSGRNRSGRFCDTAPVVCLDDNYEDKQNALQVLGAATFLFKQEETFDPWKIHSALDKELKGCFMYRECWEMAKKEFEKKKEILLQNGGRDECHIALICYSQEIYEEFNALTRELANRRVSFVSDPETNSWLNQGLIPPNGSLLPLERYPFRSLFHLLMEAIETIRGTDVPVDQELYNGRKGKFTVGVGNKVAFNQFVSTSLLKDVSMGFAKDGDPTQPWTLFHIICKKPWYTGMGLHSVYPEEQEVLLSPFLVFTCTSVETEGDYGTHIFLEDNPAELQKYAIINFQNPDAATVQYLEI